MADQARLSLGTKIGWGVADAGINVFVFFKAVVIMVFMTQYMGVSPGVAGFVSGLVVLTDMFTDPIVGAWSDRTNTRWGRRRPFMIVGAVLMLVLSYIMFNPPGLTGNAAALWVFVFYALASVGFTMVAVPFGAMATEMTKSGQERTFMMGFRMAFASIGLLVAGIVAAPAAINEGKMMTWIIVAILVLVPVTISVLATSRAPRESQHESIPAREQLRIIRGNPGFIRHVISYGIMTLGVAIISGGIGYITTNTAIRAVNSGQFDDYFMNNFSFENAEGEPNLKLMTRLGLERPEEGWITNAKELVDDADVQQIDPRVDGWFQSIDVDMLNQSPFGQQQVAGVQQVVGGAIKSQLSGLAKILFGAAGGLFTTVFAMFLLGSVFSQLFWVPLAGRIGRDRALVSGLIAYGLLAIAYLFVLRGGNFSLIIYGAGLLGFCNGAYQSLPWAIVPTMIDKANQDDNVQVEGVFNGFWLSGQKIANSIGPWVLGGMLGVFGWVSSTVDFRVQSDSASEALMVIMTVLPGVFFLVAIPLFLTIPKMLRR